MVSGQATAVGNVPPVSDQGPEDVRSPPPDPYEDEADADAAKKSKKKRKRDPLPFWLELPLLVLIALIVAVVIKTFLVQAFWIPSSSMEDTLQINDRVLVNKLAYQFGDVARGHVIVFDDPNGETAAGESFLASISRNVAEAVGLSAPRSEFIKRVIGLPGETVEVRDSKIFISGNPLAEPYLKPGSRMPDYGPVEIPADHIFVMGDNRLQSQDSRFFGPIPTDDIVGRAFVIIWPPSRWGGL